MNEHELLRAYRRTRSHEAFRRLVKRYVDFVYGAARRQVRDAHLAEDVTQAVFILLAQKADSVSADRPLAGWLHKATVYAAANARRAQATHQHHEWRASAMSQKSASDGGAGSWEDLSPLLDEGLSRLRAKDRDVILLKFFEQRTLRQVGEAMGISEEAAAKRVSRAVERLRDFFERRGVTVSAAAVSGALAANASEAAPAGLAGSVATAATTSAATGAGATLAKGAVVLIAAEKTKMAVVAAVVILLAVGGAGVAIWSIIKSPSRPEVVRADEAFEQPPEGSLRVQFEDGWTANLVAIGEEATDEWWLPDGSPAPDPQVRSRLPDEPAPEARQLHFIFSGDQLDPADQVSIRVVAPRPVPTERSTVGATWPRMETRYGASSVSHTNNLPEAADTATLHIGRASGRWHTVLHFDVETMELTSAEGDQVFRLLSITERGGLTWIEVDLPPGEPLQLNDWESVVLDTGQEVRPRAEGLGGPDLDALRKRYGFDVPREQVREFIYRSRPYEVIELRDVALRPGVRTEPGAVRTAPQAGDETRPQ